MTAIPVRWEAEAGALRLCQALLVPATLRRVSLSPWYLHPPPNPKNRGGYGDFGTKRERMYVSTIRLYIA